jgi:hypothetical protein
MSSYIVVVTYMLAGLVSLVYAQKRVPATAPVAGFKCYVFLFEFRYLVKGPQGYLNEFWVFVLCNYRVNLVALCGF